MKYIFLFFLLSFIASKINAQKITKATTFQWAGGQCCVTGQDYNVFLELAGNYDVIEAIQFVIKGVGQIHGEVHSVISKNDTTSFRVFMRNRVDRYEDQIKNETTLIDIPEFKGEALIEFKIDGKLKQIIIPKFIYLESIAYP